MNIKKTNRVKTIISLTSVIIVVISSVNIVRNVSYFDSLKKEQTATMKKAVSVKKSYEKHKEEVNKKFYSDSVNSANQLVQQVSTHNNSYIIMDNLSKDFFNVYFTWNNSSDYTDRESKLSNIADGSLLEDKKIFDNGKDATGGDYIKSLNLHSEFLNSDVSLIDSQSGIVKVVYKSWYGKQSKSGETAQYYLVDFDRDSTKIKKINSIYISEKG